MLIPPKDIKTIDHDVDGIIFERGLDRLLKCDELNLSPSEIEIERKNTESALLYLAIHYGYDIYSELLHAYRQAMSVVGLLEEIKEMEKIEKTTY